MKHLKFRLWLAALVLGCTCLVACEEGEPDHPHPASAVLISNVSGLDAGADLFLQPSHLPCEIEAIIKARCKNCHVPSTAPNRPVSLLTYADFAQPSKSAPTMTYAQQALMLVQNGMMPLTGKLPPEQIQQFADWVQAGAPQAECGAAPADAGIVVPPPVDAGLTSYDAGPIMDLDAGNWPAADAGAADSGTAYDTPTRCTSNQRWTGGDMRSELMHPGRACIACHTAGVGFLNLQHGPTFTLAGTLFPSAHEPDDCNGAPGSAVSVIVKGANGQSVTLTPNSVGNFHSATRVTMPYTVEIRYQGRVRAMTTPQSTGDCNSCHTEQGTNGAPGRIMLP